MLYSHGGYFAAAPYMLHDPQWIFILRQLMPDVYVEVAHRVHLDSAKLIHWAENNPVVAAYGTIMSQNMNGESVPIEWDVFLDPILVSKLIKALDVKEALLTAGANSESDSSPTRHKRTAQKHIEHLNKVIRSRTFNLVSNILIAHGNATQLIMEQLPKPHFVKSYNFTRVKRACKTLGGGIEVWRWLATYAQALKLGKSCESTGNSQAASDDEGTEIDKDVASSLLDSSFVDEYEKESWSASNLYNSREGIKRVNLTRSVSTIKGLMGNHLSVLLDLKSRHVDKRGKILKWVQIFCT